MFSKGTLYLGIAMWIYIPSTLKVSSTYRQENPIALHRGRKSWIYIRWNMQVGPNALGLIDVLNNIRNES